MEKSNPVPPETSKAKLLLDEAERLRKELFRTKDSVEQRRLAKQIKDLERQAQEEMSPSAETFAAAAIP